MSLISLLDRAVVKEMEKTIYFADLTHTGRGIHASTFPLGMAFVASYAQKKLGEGFVIKVFKFPEHLCQAIAEKSPDLLCLTNYCWNLELGHKISQLARERNHHLITIFGGPNFPESPAERKQFLQRRTAIDFYIQNEGETGFVELVKKLQHYHYDHNALKQSKEAVTNCVYLSGEELIQGPFQRILDLNDIPSPYLTGIMDPFFDLPLTPMIETTRGCPFTCAFCADGILSKSRVVRFERERTWHELNYIASRIKNVDELIITDLNFGMYKEDVPIAEYIAEIKKQHHWPIVIGASTGKNNKEQVLKVITILGGSLVTGAAIQSSDPEVLRNIKRSNISLEAYRGFLEFSNTFTKDAVAFTEIILALPGDTKEKHFTSLRYGIDNGAKIMRMYQAMLLTGTAMASEEMRREFQYLTKFRVIPGGVGIYRFGNQEFSVAEVEEIIVGSKDMSFNDYVSCRIMNLLIETYFNNFLFNEVFAALKTINISPFECLHYIFEHSEGYTSRMRQIIDRFIFATSKDLYPSYEEAITSVSSPKIIQQYISGELGINELLVYRAELYQHIEDLSQVLFQAVQSYLREKGKWNALAESYFQQLLAFIVCRKRAVYDYETAMEREFNYDFKALDNLNFEVNPCTIESSIQRFNFKFYHDPKQKSHIRNALKLYINTPSGMGRLLQRSNLKKMYRQFDYAEASAARSMLFSPFVQAPVEAI